MPIRHPERITRDLPERNENWLADVAGLLWPDEEYAEIIAEIWRQENPA